MVKGVTHRTAVVALAIAGLLGLVAVQATTLYQGANGDGEQGKVAASATIAWVHDGSRWAPVSTPPACPAAPILRSPVDLTRATSILYPGQTRGGDYKPHGGFRFDASRNDQITVRAPLDATVWRGSRYLEDGEVQYLFDFMAPCGVLYRFDHMRTLTPKLAKVVARFPAARVGDSRTTFIAPPITVTRGEVLAGAVGITSPPNVGVDFGVYDLRKKNRASRNPAWARLHSGELAPYAICWFDWLPTRDVNAVRNLPPGDLVNGATSDFC